VSSYWSISTFSANDFKFGLGCRAAASFYNNDGHCFIWLKKLTVRGKTIKSQYMFWLIQLWKESLNSDDDQPISTKRTITSHSNQLRENKKKTTTIEI
jgi:hypothetical protein